MTETLKQLRERDAEQPDENTLELYEFSYPKYGEHVVAMRNSPQGGGLQLFDTVKLFAKNNTLKEYDRVKDEAAAFAKQFVAQFNKAPERESAIPDMIKLIRAQQEMLEKKDAALLLAARWFKLNFEDDTLNEHPPSKADLAGMFDVMKAARLLGDEQEAGE